MEHSLPVEHVLTTTSNTQVVAILVVVPFVLLVRIMDEKSHLGVEVVSWHKSLDREFLVSL